MTDQMEQALAIQATINTPGWEVIKAMALDHKMERMEELMDIMLRTPDKLTGKTAIKIGATAKAVADFIEMVEDTQKILVAPNHRKAGQ